MTNQLRPKLRVLASLAALLLASTAAEAQDSPFSGFYVGVHGGAASTDTSGAFDSGGNPGRFDLSDLDIDGGIVGGQIGYNYQAGMFVIGVEGDASSVAGGDNITGPNPGTYTVSAEIDRLLSIRGRLGIAFNDFMLFGTVGYAEVKNTLATVDTTPANFNGSLDFTETGAVYGGGIEYAFGNGLFRIEYLRYQVGSTKDLVAGELPDSDAADIYTVDDIDVIRAALSYKIN